jgi:hypothetical protein
LRGRSWPSARADDGAGVGGVKFAKRVGRLIEMRVNHLDSTDEVEHFSQAIQRMGATTPNAVMVVDLRTPLVFSPPVTKAVVMLMTRANRVRRGTAILLAGEHAVFSLQFVRLVKQVGDPDRQTFTDPDELLAWIDDCLDPREKTRAKVFVHSR